MNEEKIAALSPALKGAYITVNLFYDGLSILFIWLAIISLLPFFVEITLTLAYATSISCTVIFFGGKWLSGKWEKTDRYVAVLVFFATLTFPSFYDLVQAKDIVCLLLFACEYVVFAFVRRDCINGLNMLRRKALFCKVFTVSLLLFVLSLILLMEHL